MECELCHQQIQEDQGYYLVSEKGCCKQCYDLNIKKTLKNNAMFFVPGTAQNSGSLLGKRKVP